MDDLKDKVIGAVGILIFIILLCAGLLLVAAIVGDGKFNTGDAKAAVKIVSAALGILVGIAGLNLMLKISAESDPMGRMALVAGALVLFLAGAVIINGSLGWGTSLAFGLPIAAIGYGLACCGGTPAKAKAAAKK